MCGIVGCAAKANAVRFIANGLKRIEYRGYDSHGIAVKVGGDFFLHHAVGPISDATLPLELDCSNIHTAIGHTRWATHGAVTERNCHPVVYRSIAVVHNGTLNADNWLLEHWFGTTDGFKTGTDTEIIARLIDQKYQEYINKWPNPANYPLAEAVCNAVSILEDAGKTVGAFVAMHATSENDLLVCYSNGSPLLVSNNGYIASDRSALSGYADKAYRIGPSEVVLVKKNSYDLIRSRIIQDDRVEVSIPNSDAADKCGYDHYMLKEIHEQIELVKNPRVQKMPDYSRVMIFGCGSSYLAGMIGAKYLEQSGIPTTVRYSCEMSGFPVEDETLYIALSQSGETKDTIEAAEHIKDCGHLMVIHNSPGSTLEQLSDSSINIDVGQEVGVASTKSFLITALTLKHMASEHVNIAELKQLSKDIDGMCKRFRLDWQDESARNVLFLGEGIYYPIALEAALKMKEVSYIHAEGMPASEMKHGPIALIDEKMPVFFIYSSTDHKVDRIKSNIQEVKSRGGIVHVISDENGLLTNNPYQPFLAVVYIQLLAYYKALNNPECNIDQPRNLAKSVTV